MPNDPQGTPDFPSQADPQTREPAGASALVEIDLAALSHPGKVRTNNEDHFIVARFDRAMRTLLTNLPEGEVPRSYAETVYGMLVADGVGGAAAGEVASRTAIHALMDLVIETPDWIMRIDDQLAREVLERLERRFQKVRDVLLERTREDPKLRGMATTMTVACSLGTELMVAHVGDSRAYLFHEGQLSRLTRDQTMAQSLADAGAIRQDEVATHPARHILTSAIATRGAFVQVELKRVRLSDGDRLLLCSDGLTEMAAEEAIAGVLRGPGRSEDVARRLVDLALDGGGEDNITVVLAGYRIPSPGSTPH